MPATINGIVNGTLVGALEERAVSHKIRDIINKARSDGKSVHSFGFESQTEDSQRLTTSLKPKLKSDRLSEKSAEPPTCDNKTQRTSVSDAATQADRDLLTNSETLRDFAEPTEAEISKPDISSPRKEVHVSIETPNTKRGLKSDHVAAISRKAQTQRPMEFDDQHSSDDDDVVPRKWSPSKPAVSNIRKTIQEAKAHPEWILRDEKREDTRSPRNVRRVLASPLANNVEFMVEKKSDQRKPVAGTSPVYSSAVSSTEAKKHSESFEDSISDLSSETPGSAYSVALDVCSDSYGNWTSNNAFIPPFRDDRFFRSGKAVMLPANPLLPPGQKDSPERRQSGKDKSPEPSRRSEKEGDVENMMNESKLLKNRSSPVSGIELSGLNEMHTNSALMYSKEVSWRAQMRKEIFLPGEICDDENTLNMIFHQLCADCFGNIDPLRLDLKERNEIVQVLESNGINMQNYSQKQVSRAIKQQVLQISRRLPIYFSRIYTVKSEKHVEPMPHCLAISENGIWLLYRMADGRRKVVRNFPFDDVESAKSKRSTITLTLCNGMKEVFETRDAAEVAELICQFLYGPNQVSLLYKQGL
ncbi:unnamed protein product [Soboliphyme baturini]|uniref:Fanconi anemia group M protein n=1 Tax=Soboliphyme baturini TaxID=241478 RepID=A0A183J240_9BILA|nr:unnamed protein product [Soboliphyme baturini]